LQQIILLIKMDCVQSGRYFSVERLVPAAHYFIFSDQPEAARARCPMRV
jgi:hypothetical protein